MIICISLGLRKLYSHIAAAYRDAGQMFVMTPVDVTWQGVGTRRTQT